MELKILIKNESDHVLEIEPIDLEKEVKGEEVVRLLEKAGKIITPGQRIKIEDFKTNICVALKARDNFTLESYLKANKFLFNYFLKEK